MPLTDAGYTPYTITELRTILRGKYQTLTGETPTWDQDDFLGSFSEAVLAIAVLPGQGVQAVYDAFKLTNASGRFLENLCELAGIQREEATRSRVTLTFAGTPGTIILTGKRVEGTSNNERWSLIEDVTLDGGGAGSGVAEAETLGAVAGPLGTITKIVTPVSGWDSVTNAADAVLGDTRESDAELRLRYQRDLQAGSVATIPAITSALEELTFVERAVVIGNGAETDLTVGSYTIPPHDILILLDVPVLTATEETELAEAMLNVLAATTNTVGTNSVSTTYRGTTFTFDYADPASVSIAVVATLTIATGFTLSEVAAEVEAAVEAHINGLSIGDDVTFLGIYGAVSAVDGLAGVSFTLNGGAADIAIAQTEIPNYNAGGSSYS